MNVSYKQNRLPAAFIGMQGWHVTNCSKKCNSAQNIFFKIPQKLLVQQCYLALILYNTSGPSLEQQNTIESLL